jgi:hypothetical protein
VKKAPVPGIRLWAARVADGFARTGIEVVLTGGACVSIYTRNKYASYDLDFVNVGGVSGRVIAEVLGRAGFRKEGRVFTRADCPYSVDILGPPLSIGAEQIVETATMIVGGRELKLLTPTDSVKDRLAAYFHWNDLQALEQALMVARSREVDLSSVRNWAVSEGHLEKFKAFKQMHVQRTGGKK